MSEKLDVNEKILLEELKKNRFGKKGAEAAGGSGAGTGFLIKNTEELEGYFLALFLLPPNIAEHIEKIEEYGYKFSNPDFQKVYEAIKPCSGERLQKEDLMLDLKKILTSELFQNLSEIMLKAEYYYEIGNESEKTDKAFEELLKRLVFKQYEMKQKILERDIKT